MSAKRRTSRRQFLVDAGLSTTYLAAIDLVFGSLLRSQSAAWAAAAPDSGFKYFIQFTQRGACPRWGFDLMLNPLNQADAFLASKTVANVYQGTGSYTSATYRLARLPGTNYYGPHLLNLNVPTGSGGTVRAGAFLNKTVQIRGIDVFSASHPGAMQFHQAAIPGELALGSVLADRAVPSSDPTQSIIRAMSLDLTDDSNAFLSRAGHLDFKFAANGAVDNLSALFASLRPISQAAGFTPTFMRNNAALADRVKTALDALSPSAKQYYASLLDNSDASFRILTDTTVQTFADLKASWDARFPVYQGLAQQVLLGTYPAINDTIIGGMTSIAPNERSLYTCRTGVVFGGKNSAGKIDLRLMIQGAHADRLAAQFTVMEFLVKKGICPSIMVQPFQLENLNINGIRELMVLDQHETGAMVSVLVNSMYWLTYSAMLNELIASLTSAGLFNSTLMYMSSEFNRAARVDGSGSDHAPQAAHVNLISGRVPAHRIVGNILRDSAGVGTDYSSTYKGSWGHGAPIAGKTLDIVQVWGSVLNLLGLPLSEIPNRVDKTRLLFNTAGDLTISSLYNAEPQTIRNGSKS